MELHQISNVPDEDAVAELLTLTCGVDKHGTKFYKNKEGEFHRIHGPAIIRANNEYEWYKNGKRHREDGPAIMYADGEAHWYKNGMRHREDGPAIDWSGGQYDYYLNDKGLAYITEHGEKYVKIGNKWKMYEVDELFYTKLAEYGFKIKTI